MSELDDLKKRILELEKKVNSNLKAFGRSFSETGSSNSDLLLKTRGSVKIQWGNKFIDLIKNGKINVDTRVIFQQDSVGSKDGIYVVGDQIILQVNGTQINLKGEIGTTYVSFQGTQETSSDQKLTALKNIGFIYENLQDIDENAIQNGIVYVTGEQKLYTIVNGIVSELKLNIPNPFTEQFIIAKNDSKQGALVIQGEGIENSIAFPTMYMYSDGDSILDSNENIEIRINNSQKVLITPSLFYILNTLIASNIQSSPNANQNSGFRLYIGGDGYSVLEVDKIIERQKTEEHDVDLYPTYFVGQTNIITDIIKEDSENEEDPINYTITLQNQNVYQKYDGLIVFIKQINEDEEDGETLITTYQRVNLLVNNVDKQQITVTSDFEFEKEQLKSLLYKPIFKIKADDPKYIPLRFQNENLDLIKYLGTGESSTELLARLGDIEEYLFIRNNNGTTELIEGPGFYSKVGVFHEVQYNSTYKLPLEDNSSRLVSTEWFHKWLPAGTIVMFNGSSDIPEGWAICDGRNGTPNLIDKFIVAGTNVGPSDDSNSMDYPFEINSGNVPVGDHTHQVSISSEKINSTGDGEVSITIPDHTHSLKFVTTSKAKRVETGDGEGAQNYHFGGVGSIYKGEEQWDAATGSGGIVQSYTWDGSSLVHKAGGDSVTGSFDVSVTGTTSGQSVESSKPQVGTENSINLKPPRYYSLIFIMKLYPITQ